VDMLTTLLKSKRVWVMVVTMCLHFLAKYHVVVSDASADAIADQLVLIAGAVAIVGTKIADSHQAVAIPKNN
jgi:hypothetical protein